MRKTEACHAQEPVHVRLEHGVLVVLSARRERVAAQREAGPVDEDVQAPESLDRLRDEPLAARRVGDVQSQRHVARDAFQTACAARDPCSFALKRPRCGRSNPARGARDDGGLAFEGSHGGGD